MDHHLTPGGLFVGPGITGADLESLNNTLLPGTSKLLNYTAQHAPGVNRSPHQGREALALTGI